MVGEASNERRRQGAARGPLPRLRGRLRSRCRSLRDASGQSLIEFALVFLPLALIIFGGIDFGFILKDFIAVRQGVSDSAREAAVGQFGTSSSCPLAGVGGASDTTKKLLCTVHSLDGIHDDSRTRVAIFVGDSQHVNDFTQGQPITICEQYRMHSVTGIIPFVDGNVATSTATDMIELSGVSPAPTSTAETAFPASSWPPTCTSGPAPTS